MNTLWKTTAERPEFPAPDGDISADAVVIGGGICGALTAYMLQKRGVDTVLLERDRIGCGLSSATTAKITAAHSNVYSKLVSSLGAEYARTFALVSAAAIDEYEALIKQEKINCDFERLPTFLYARHGERLLRRELCAAKAAGLNVSWHDPATLQIPALSALKLPDQAQFHPLKFLYSLSERIKAYEHCGNVRLDGGKAVTDYGSVRAKYFVSATNYPAIGTLKGGYFAKVHRELAHVLTLSPHTPLGGMYIGVDGGANYRSWGEHLIVSGESHVSGCGVDGAYERLRREARESFPEAEEEMRWSAEDSMTLDGLPYIGRYSGGSETIFTASGFGKWGMTTAMAGAVTVAELICGKTSMAAAIFDPSRFTPRASAEEFASMTARAVRGMSSRFFMVPERELSDVGRGDGEIIRYMGRKVGAYRDMEGEVHLVEPKCPHLGCELSWNGDDLTWDCPCHGSRFTFDGALITGPADRAVGIEVKKKEMTGKK